jgi:Flp pilus assembly pilin Flp
MLTMLYNHYLALDEKGQGIIEYAIIVAVVIAAGLAIWGVFGDALVALYEDLVARIALPE